MLGVMYKSFSHFLRVLKTVSAGLGILLLAGAVFFPTPKPALADYNACMQGLEADTAPDQTDCCAKYPDYDLCPGGIQKYCDDLYNSCFAKGGSIDFCNRTVDNTQRFDTVCGTVVQKKTADPSPSPSPNPSSNACGDYTDFVLCQGEQGTDACCKICPTNSNCTGSPSPTPPGPSPTPPSTNPYSSFSDCMKDQNDNWACCQINDQFKANWPECKSINNPPTNPPTTPPGSPSPSPSPSTACTQGSCGPGFCQQNGLCIPKTPFSGSGIASSSTIMEVILKVLKILLTMVGIVAVLFIILGGFWYMTAGGNEEQAEKGKKALLNAIIGLVVIVLSYAIVAIITKALTEGIPGT